MKTRTSDASNGDVVDTCRAQRRVRKQFEEIDAGRLDPQSVFSKISGGKLVKWDVNMAEMEIRNITRWDLNSLPISQGISGSCLRPVHGCNSVSFPL